MKNNTKMKILNMVLALLMLVQFISGAMNERMSKETFEHIHVLGGLLMLIGVVLHLVWNWGWVKANFFKK